MIFIDHSSDTILFYLKFTFKNPSALIHNFLEQHSEIIFIIFFLPFEFHFGRRKIEQQ